MFLKSAPRGCWPLALAGSIACSSQSAAPPAPAPEKDASTGQAGAGQDAQPAGDGSGELDGPGADGSGKLEAAAPVIAATHGSATFPFRFDGQGAGQDRLGQVSATANLATVQFAGKAHTGVLYQSHAWTSAGYDLYDIVSIADDGSNLAVTYLYCQGKELTWAYTESLLDPMNPEQATGSCEAAAQPTDVEVNLPALHQLPPPLDTGITISGTDIELGPDGGSIQLGGLDYALMPFATVDCSQCPGGPWYELHTLLLGDQQGCFAILYLHPDNPGSVQVAYTLCLPSLLTPTAVYQAAWSGELLKSWSKPLLPRPAPPAAETVLEHHD